MLIDGAWALIALFGKATNVVVSKVSFLCLNVSLFVANIMCFIVQFVDSGIGRGPCFLDPLCHHLETVPPFT